MIRDFIESVRATLYERVTSPLAGVFFLSWIAFNWKLVVVMLLGEGSIFTRISFIERSGAGLNHLLWYPLAVTSGILFLYPLAAVLPFAWWQLGNRWKANLKKRIEGKQLLSLEQSNKLRTEISRVEAQYRKELEEREGEIDALERQIQRLADSEASLQEEIEKLEAERSHRSVDQEHAKESPILQVEMAQPPELSDRNATSMLVANMRKSHPERTIPVSTPEEFLDAIGSNRTIRLSNGDYNLSDIEGYGDNPHIEWPSVHDGANLIINGVDNMHILSESKVSARVLVAPAYAWVLDFNDCEGLSLENLELGHTSPGMCTGGVLRAFGCHEVAVRSCVLFGSGTEGVTLRHSSNLAFEDVQVRDCTESIMTIENSVGIVFRLCSFRKNDGYDMINISDSSEVAVLECEIADNTSKSGPGRYEKSALFNIDMGSVLEVRESKVMRNRIEYFERYEGTTWLKGTDIGRNEIAQRFEHATFEL